MLPNQPTVTIVIVTWNKRDDILHLLDSLQSVLSADIKIIVVDNASTDGSVEAVRKHPLPVILVENVVNLGGTGGFNTGIRYALNILDQEYIWLLDNDAEVTPDTLEKLIIAMESDASIGIAGSCILNPDDRTQIVEAGGFVDERTATWKPHLRYHTYSPYQHSSPMDVEYVPACSALVRRTVFEKIGLLDERYFLHWDDVDFGRTARVKGFRVVTVFNSVVYHGTEKGYSNTVLYYDVRNSLLFISKHLSVFQRIAPMFRVCLRSQLASQLFEISGEKLLSWHLDQALENFASGRFGPAPDFPAQVSAQRVVENLPTECLSAFQNVVVFAVGSADDIHSTAQLIKSAAPCASILLAAPSDRIDSYRSCGLFDGFISYDLARYGISGVASTGFTLFRSRFDCALSAGSGFIIPFAFFVRRHLVVSDNGKNISESKACLSSLWKLPFVVVSGFVMSLSTTLKCWLARHRF